MAGDKDDANNLRKLEIKADSMLFVNDRTHGRHKKKKTKKGQNNEGPAAEDAPIDLVQFFNPNETTQLVDEDQLYCLHNEYDYAVTRMLRLFLKGDEVYKMVTYEKKQATDQFFTSCK